MSLPPYPHLLCWVLSWSGLGSGYNKGNLMTQKVNVSWTVLAVALVVGLAGLALGQIAGCGYLDAPPTQTPPPARLTTAASDTPLPAPAPVNRGEDITTKAQSAVATAQPVADTVQTVTGWPVGSVLRLVGEGLGVIALAFRERGVRRRDYALNRLHDDVPTGAPALVTDPKAKAIIADITGV